MTRAPRKFKPHIYSATDPGILVFNRSDIIEEIPATVQGNGMIYAGKGTERKDVIILVLRNQTVPTTELSRDEFGTEEIEG